MNRGPLDLSSRIFYPGVTSSTRCFRADASTRDQRQNQREPEKPFQASQERKMQEPQNELQTTSTSNLENLWNSIHTKTQTGHADSWVLDPNKAQRFAPTEFLAAAL